MFLMFRKLLLFLMTGAVFDNSSRSSAKNLLEFLRQDFLFSGFGVVRLKKFSFSFYSGISWVRPRSNLFAWLKLGLNLIFSFCWGKTSLPSMSFIEAALRLDFLKKVDFSPGVLIKIVSPPCLLLIDDRLRMLFRPFSCDFVKMKCSESLMGSVFLISSYYY